MTETAIVKWTAGGSVAPAPDTRHARDGRVLSNVDGWANVLTGLGLANRDKRISSSFVRECRFSRDELDAMYHGDGLICRLCELPAKEMTREWIELNDPDQVLSNKLAALNARRKVFEAITWSRLYGACVIVMIVNDGRRMDQPLDVERVKAIDDLLVIDRHDLSIVRRYGDASKPKFAQPELYEIRTSAISLPGQVSTQTIMARIHESRCLVFEGTLTGRRRKIDEEGWAQSIVERVYGCIRDFISSYDGAAHLLTDYSQAVFKIKGLANMLNNDGDDKVLKRLRLLDLSRSVARAIPLDAEGEDFKREVTSVAGLPDLLDRMAERLSSEIDIPITRLLGRSSGGLNSTGDGEERQFNNAIRNDQETNLRPPLQTLINVTAKAIGFKAKDAVDGNIPFSFRALWTPSENEIATTRKLVAEVDVMYHGIGVLDSAEIAISRFGGDKYSLETQIDQDATPTNSNKDPIPEGEEIDPNAEPKSEEDAKASAELVKATGVPADKTVQDTAMNGAQMKAIADMMTLVKTMEMEAEPAIDYVLLTCPTLDPERVKTMFGKIKPEKPPEPVIAPGGFGAPKPDGSAFPGGRPPAPGQPAAKPGAPAPAKKPDEE